MEKPNTLNTAKTSERTIRFPERAVWSHRTYSRHSVEKDVKHFCGWPLLLKMVGYAKTKHQKWLIAALFETGGRVSEVLRLTTRMFTLVKDAKPPILIVQGMPLVKKFNKVGEFMECLKCHTWNSKGAVNCEKCGENLLKNGQKRFETERLQEERNEFVIRLDEPLAKILAQAIVETIKRYEKELIPKPLIFYNSYTEKSYNRRWAYKVLRKIGKKAGSYFYPHRLRAERACHLASTLKAESLLEWFSWEHWKTAKRYAKKGAVGLAKELGVELPKKHN